MLAAKKSAGFAPEVSLRNPLHAQEAKPDAKLTCNLVRMRNKRPLAYQHQHPSFWRQLEILRKLKIGSSMGNFL